MLSVRVWGSFLSHYNNSRALAWALHPRTGLGLLTAMHVDCVVVTLVISG